MSYPQPNATEYAIKSQSFFRLNTTLLTDGDIYQSEQGAWGFAVGPDSDISRINIAYFDQQVARFQNQVVISPDRPFLGGIGARNDLQYAPSGEHGKILIWPDQIFNSNWRPNAFDPTLMRVDFVSPVIDVVQYFSPTAVNNGQRNDKAYHYDRLPLTGMNNWWLIIPYWGRRMASVKIQNDSGASLKLGTYALNYRPKIDAMAPEESGYIMQLDDSGTINNGDYYGYVALASARATLTAPANIGIGFFDALALHLSNFTADNSSEITLDIVTSDTEA